VIGFRVLLRLLRAWLGPKPAHRTVGGAVG
jgi:hypothetical protein